MKKGRAQGAGPGLAAPLALFEAVLEDDEGLAAGGAAAAPDAADAADEAAESVDDVPAPVSLPPDAVAAASVLPASEDLLLPESRKSVTYHPLPLS